MALFLWSLLITDKCKGQDIGIQLGTKGINCFPLYPIIKIDEEQQICQYKTVQIVDTSTVVELLWEKDLYQYFISTYQKGQKGRSTWKGIVEALLQKISLEWKSAPRISAATDRNWKHSRIMWLDLSVT